MTSSIPAVFSRLIDLAGQSVAGIPGAVVADGWSDDVGATMFGVGSEAPPFLNIATTNVEATPTWDGLGAMHVNEDYTIPCYIYVGAGGTDNSRVRATAFGVWDVFWPLFRTDVKSGFPVNRYAEIPRLTASSAATSEEAQGGRYCLIQFWVHCLNVI